MYVLAGASFATTLVPVVVVVVVVVVVTSTTWAIGRSWITQSLERLSWRADSITAMRPNVSLSYDRMS